MVNTQQQHLHGSKGLDRNAVVVTENNPSSTYQSINYGGDQNIHAGRGDLIVGGVVNNIGGDLVQTFTTTTSNPHKTLWDAVAGVGASHKAEHQFSRGECLEGTREEALRIIRKWKMANDQDFPVCWLSGSAGAGKSAIAMTVAKSSDGNGLISSFFFFRSDPRRNNPSALILTIAHGLVVTKPSVRDLVNQRITEDPRILEARLEDQFRELVLTPSLKRSWRKRVRDLFMGRSIRPKEPNLVIIDGLDECSDEETQLRILSTILSAYRQQPCPPLKFLVCSRPESWIREAFDAPGLGMLTKCVVLDETFEPAKDIERYFRHAFQQILESSKYGHVEFPTPWPSVDDLKCLVRRSDGQFVYAATVIKFLRIILQSPYHLQRRPSSSKSPFHELDCLYHIILNSNPEPYKVLPILAAILILPLPSPEVIELVLGLTSGEVALTLRAMYSVLEINGDPVRAGEFYIDRPAQHYFLARRWIQALSVSRVRKYSLDQLYDTKSFFTGCLEFCISLPNPPPGLLDDLRNLDFATVFFCKMVRGVQPEWRGIFRGVVSWLESGEDSVDPNLMSRFSDPPNCFHLHLDPRLPSNHDIIHWAILTSTGCIAESSMTVQVNKAYNDRASITPEHPFLLTACSCCDHDSDDVAHRTYQSACLHTLQILVSDFHIHESRNESGIGSEANAIFKNLSDSTLLQHCAFQPELFALCDLFLSAAKACQHLKMSPGQSRRRRAKLLGWLETFPERYATEAELLKSRVISTFPEETEASSSVVSSLQLWRDKIGRTDWESM
ncbi:hypothetical protein V5O48_015560 [Marasmius crinis-equi]|uniref:Nephrocystin 3-like N-terminal domain-containing protein n=1 Tax=Marasmius crinis-equi TaxID=585013 RepID=A0ABR3EUI7_9AGAR